MRTHEGKSRYARRYTEKYGMSELADQTAMPEQQASNLIDLVVDGADPDELMGVAIDGVREGYGGGPYAIGTSVKIGKTWNGPSVQGGSVSLSRGDVVSIVQPNLGETGHDKMVLFSDGATRAIVPLDILENTMVGYPSMGGGSMSMGPKGHIMPSAKGSPGGLIQQRALGQSKPRSLPDRAGVKSATSHPATSIGQGKPKDDPSAQVAGKGYAMTWSGIAVEAVFDMLDSMLEGADDQVYRRISEFARLLHDANDVKAFAEVYEMLFGENQHTIEDLEALFSIDEGDMASDDELGDMDADERKKYLAKYRKKYSGKYMGMDDHAKKMMMKYGSNHAKKMMKYGSNHAKKMASKK